MIPRKQAYLKLNLILLIFFLLALAHSLWLPLHEAPDEVAHFLYSRFIARTGRLPLNYEERAEAGYLSFWPPLYHTVVATLAGWSDNGDSPHLKFVWQSPRFDMARELLDTKRLANTEDEFLPYQGGVLMWHLGRVVSILLSMGTIWVTFMTALEIWPNNYRRAVLSAAMIAFVPAFIFISSAVSYESLVGLVTGLYFWVFVKIIKGDPRRRNYVLLGLLMGMSVTVKYTAVILPVQVIGVFAFLAWKYGWGWSGWLKRVTLTALVSILASSWWFLFLTINFNETAELGPVIGILKPIIAGGIDISQNYTAAILTGGQIGTTESLEISSDPFWAWLVRIYQTFWVREIDGFPLWPVAHILIGLTCLAAVVGLVSLWRHQPHQRVWVGIFVSHILIFFVFPLLRFGVQGNVRWTAQGRHVLFPAATVLPLLITWGWQGWLSLKVQRRLALAVVGGLLCWSMVQLIRVIDYPLLYLPIRTTPEVSAQISHRLEQAFGDHLVLLGYDLETAPADSALKIKLYWQSSAYVDEDYLMNIALVQNDVPQFSWSTYPVNGRYPTRIWESWETIHDDIWLPLVDVPPGNYQLQLQLRGFQGVLPVGKKDTLVLGDVSVPEVAPIQPDILFRTSVEGEKVVTGAKLWQAERFRKIDLPEYRPRMQIPFVWQGQTKPDDRVVWLLVAPGGQVYPATPVTDHFGYFIVGIDWPSGEYRLRLERWRGDAVIASQESEPVAVVFNEKPRLTQAPSVSHPLNVNFGNRIKLLGYDLPVRSLSPGQGVPVTFYWQDLRTMGQSYTVFTKLLDEQRQPWGNAERLPADGYNTIYWLENEVVIDSFELPVNPDIPQGVYWLNLGLYKEVDGVAVSLPIMVNEQPTEQTSVTIGPVKIGGPPSGVVLSSAEVRPVEPLSIEFGAPPVILLRGYDVVQNNEELKLTLYWESLAQTPIDWTTFVHLRNKGGQTVAQKDGPVGSGRYPTSLWETGEIVADEIVIPLTDLPDDDYRLFIGLYNFITGERLSVPNNPASEVLLVEDVLAKSSVSSSELRRLAASGELATLAEVLDHSMVYIPAGEFTMGSDTAHEDERPERQVYLDAFELDRYEVTNVQYQRFLQESGEPVPQYWLDGMYPTGQADHPVVGVSWSQAKAYCEWAGKRLPTEAEWEKACCGSNGNIFPWGNVWEPQRANVGYAQAQNWPLRLDEGWALLQSTAPSPDAPHLQPVGSYPEGQSAYGVFDLTGNASEWVADWYNWSGYWDMPSRNPIGTEPPWNHSIRGSGWFDRRGYEDLIQDLSRCSSRNSSHSYDDPRLGFRCAR